MGSFTGGSDGNTLTDSSTAVCENGSSEKSKHGCVSTAGQGVGRILMFCWPPDPSQVRRLFDDLVFPPATSTDERRLECKGLAAFASAANTATLSLFVLAKPFAPLAGLVEANIWDADMWPLPYPGITGDAHTTAWTAELVAGIAVIVPCILNSVMAHPACGQPRLPYAQAQRVRQDLALAMDAVRAAANVTRALHDLWLAGTGKPLVPVDCRNGAVPTLDIVLWLNKMATSAAKVVGAAEAIQEGDAGSVEAADLARMVEGIAATTQNALGAIRTAGGQADRFVGTVLAEATWREETHWWRRCVAFLRKRTREEVHRDRQNALDAFADGFAHGTKSAARDVDEVAANAAELVRTLNGNSNA